MFLSICDNPDVLSIMRIIKIIINIIMVIAPIILIISLMFSFTNAVKSNDDDALMKEFKNAIPKIIATLLIFFVPTIINIILSVTLNVPYKQCFNSATTEGISSAYINIAKDSLNSAKKSLKDSDLQKAKNAISKITDNSVKEELNKEAELISEYVKINNNINKLSSNFDAKLFDSTKKQIDNISDEEVKDRLSKLLDDKIGSKAVLSSFDLNPDAAIYKNLNIINPTSGTIDDVLKKCGSSSSSLNNKILQAVSYAGVGTREAPAVAAITLIDTLANCKSENNKGYKISYYWGGKYAHIGINKKWGSPASGSSCSMAADPEECKKIATVSGLDCSGFVQWALIQGFQNEGVSQIQTKISSNDINLDPNKAVCDVGDTLRSNEHIVLVIGFDNAKKKYIVAEASAGVKISYYNYNDSGYKCHKVKYSN